MLSRSKNLFSFERSKGIAMSRFARKPAGYSSAFGAPIADVTSIDLSGEKHYSVAEVAKLWDLSEKTIRRMFEHEPGVLCGERAKLGLGADTGRFVSQRRSC